MSKAVKRKITVELPKPRDLSKNRLSVFQRLGTKKPKTIVSESKSITDDLKQTLSAAVSITTKPTLLPTPKPDNVELEDADPDILEKKRAEIQKELELQLRMESRKAAAKDAALRKRKRMQSSSSSSSSSSDSGSSSSSSSSSSTDERHKRKMKMKRRDSSSSSDEMLAKKLAKKRLCHSKKEAKLQKMSHAKKLQIIASKTKRRSVSPLMKKQRASSSSEVVINSKGQKMIVKSSKFSAEKHHRLREKERELELREREREKERERERLRLKENEHMRSRSPKPRPRSRSPKRLSGSREFSKQRTPPNRRISPSRSRVGSTGRPIPRRPDSRERERRDKERQDREAAREKERREALARCQERQRERERLAKEKTRRVDEKERLLPRPAERAMAIAAARGCSRDSMEPDHPDRSMEKEHFNRSYGDRQGSYDDVRRHERDDRDHDREYVRNREGSRDRSRDSYTDQKYENHPRRDDRRGEYQSRTGYVDEQRHRNDHDREWVHDDVNQRETYDRNADRNQPRDWEHGRHPDVPHSSNRDNYESREWSSVNDTPQSWDNRQTNTSWKPEPKNWDHYKEEKWQDPKLTPQPPPPNRNILDKVDDHITPPGLKGIVSRRWTNWRGRRGNHHNNDFRRQIQHTPGHHHPVQEGYEERGDIYRRHINPQGAGITNEIHPVVRIPVVQKPCEPIVTEEKPSTDDVSPEEIRDDLSEISDEADDILNCQEDELQMSVLTASHETNVAISYSSPRHNSVDNSDKDLDLDIDLCIELDGQNFKPDYEFEHPTRAKTPKPEVLTLTNKETVKAQTETTKKVDSPVPPMDVSIIKQEESIIAKDISDDIDLDFEEISDGELEEEARIKGLGDALGVDWSSLVEESKAITREKFNRIETSAKQRWQSHRIFLDVGISFKMAGKEFATKLLKEAHQKLMEESKVFKKETDIKKEKIDEPEDCVKPSINIADPKEQHTSADSNEQKITVKRDTDDNKQAVPAYDEQLHALACAQVASRINAHKQSNVVFNATGPYSRALCARRDIAMRRQLCNLPIVENNCKTSAGKQSTGYESLAIKLFQKAISATR